jgi:hypothetical protein
MISRREYATFKIDQLLWAFWILGLDRKGNAVKASRSTMQRYEEWLAAAERYEPLEPNA